MTAADPLRYKPLVEQTPLRDAFSRHAAAYDSLFTDAAGGQAMRRIVWEAAGSFLPEAGRLLDLGCGTGEDAVYFAKRGLLVDAVDIAPGMIDALKLKADAAGVAGSIAPHLSDVESFKPAAAQFDAVFSNFGAINCIADTAGIGRLAAEALKPNGHLILVCMGKFVPLEAAVFLAKGDLRRAFRRVGKMRTAPVEGTLIPVWYHSPRDLRRGLGSHFSLQRILGLKALLPPPGLDHLGTRLPLRILEKLDYAFTRFRCTAAFADHYLSIWRYS